MSTPIQTNMTDEQLIEWFWHYCNQGWSALTSAKKAGMSSDKYRAVRARNPDFENELIARNLVGTKVIFSMFKETPARVPWRRIKDRPLTIDDLPVGSRLHKLKLQQLREAK